MPSLSHAVLSATLSEARPKFFKRRTFEDDQELERREAVKLHLVPRTDEAKVMAERFGSGSPWQWILEHALIRRKLRPNWAPLRTQQDVLRSMRSCWRAADEDSATWRELVQEARRLEEPAL